MTGQGSKNPSQFVLDISTASSVSAPLLQVPSANACPTVIKSPSMTFRDTEDYWKQLEECYLFVQSRGQMLDFSS